MWHCQNLLATAYRGSKKSENSNIPDRQNRKRIKAEKRHSGGPTTLTPPDSVSRDNVSWTPAKRLYALKKQKNKNKSACDCLLPSGSHSPANQQKRAQHRMAQYDQPSNEDQHHKKSSRLETHIRIPKIFDMIARCITYFKNKNPKAIPRPANKQPQTR